jgi:hypothetical protein
MANTVVFVRTKLCFVELDHVWMTGGALLFAAGLMVGGSLRGKLRKRGGDAREQKDED